ncbi:MAG: DUF4392 domain-containing protein [Chloroflexi bacterium]|nr:DUF4392 domain-containing protein [Chloroflexota bacterium]
MTLDLRGYGVPRALYQAARDLAGGPVIMRAARLIAERVAPNAAVAICTGFVFPPYFVGELDGVVGSAVLARALEIGLGARLALLLEPELVDAAAAVVRTAGLQPTDSFEHWRARPHQALVLGFTKDEAAAPAEAERLLDELQPAAVIAVERPGRNARGAYHMGNGVAVTEPAAKLDHLFERAAARGALTVAIGDLGNELGMGRLQEAVRAQIPFGARCACPCGGGIAAAVGADATVVAAVSDWAAYGLAAALRYLTGRSEALHSGELECRLLRAAVAAGLIDGSGYAIPAVDGIGEEHNARLVEMLRTVVEQPLVTRERMQPMFERVLELRGQQR